MSGQFKSKTSWRDKLNKAQDPKIVVIPAKMRSRFGGARTMLIPRPLDVESQVRRIPKGKLATQSEIRARLAKDGGADVSCPITTGIFLRIVAEAAEEERGEGKKAVTPYWRVIRDGGALNEKFPGGLESQAKNLRLEGHRVARPRPNGGLRVIEFELKLTKL